MKTPEYVSYIDKNLTHSYPKWVRQNGATRVDTSSWTHISSFGIYQNGDLIEWLEHNCNSRYETCGTTIAFEHAWDATYFKLAYTSNEN